MRTELYDNVMGEPEVLSIVLDKRKEYFEALGKKYAGVKRIYVVGSGTSYHAGLSVRRQMEKLSGVEVVASYPSVFMETQVLPQKDVLCVGISQSGRSAITVRAIDRCRKLGYFTAGISSNKPSALTEAAEDYIPLVVGVEHSASTKGYVTSMLSLILLSMEIGLSNGHIDAAVEQEVVSAFEAHVRNFPVLAKKSEEWVARNEEDMLKAVRISVLGYEGNYGTALEGALKLLETIRVMVAGYDFEEWLHGAYNALTPESYLFICRSASRFDYKERVGKLEEIVRPFTEHVFVIGAEDESNPRNLCAPFSGNEYVLPLEYIIPYQMMIALLPQKKGINADRVLIPNFHTAVGSKSVR